MRQVLFVLMASAAFGSIMHCSQQYGDEPAPSADAAETDVADAARDADAALADASDASFCANARDAALCEDFEGTFPPTQWTVGSVSASVTLRKSLGLDSNGALEAAYVPGSSDAGFVNGALLHTFAGTPTALRILSSLYVVRDEAPEGETFFLILGFGGQLVALGTSPDSKGIVATVIGANADGDAASASRTLGSIEPQWVDVELRITASGQLTTLTAIMGGKVAFSGVVPLRLGFDPPTLSLGLRTPSSSGGRVVRFDNVLVEIL